MAAAVERPLPDTTNREIIDVDEFDFSPQRPQRTQGHREQIHFVNSDGEEETIEILSPRLQHSSINGSRPTRHYVPGGPRRDPSVPPPVPPIPARFSAYPTSFPRRRQAQSTGLPNLPPVIPSQEPLAFERIGSSFGRHTTASPAPVAASSTSRSGPPQAAPASHYTPSMGLGGALISSNRRESQQRQRAHLAAEMRRRNRAFLLDTFGSEDAGPSSGFGSGSGSSNTGATSRGSRRRRWHGITNNFEELLASEDDHAHAQHIHLLINSGPGPLPGSSTWQSTGMSWHDLALGHMYTASAAAETRDKEQYQQRYTHPLRPEPGFTFDFDGAQADAPIILDDDGFIVTSDVQVTSSLVCARCTEPLVLNAAMAEEEAVLKRIWALRCGHLIDEKCLNEIGQPNDEETAQTPAIVDRKGKGKAKAVPLPSLPRAEPPQPQPLTIPDSEATGISSRLRSRLAATANAIYSMVDPSAGQVEDPPQPPPAKKRRVTKRKPKIEGTFVWLCPVASCRREHVSVKIDGVWGPEKVVPTTGGKKAALAAASQEPRGAIPVFA